MSNQSNEVVIITKNTPSLVLGIISLVIGVLAILVGWVPFLGLLAIPFAIIGLFIAGIGALIALLKGFKGIKIPLLGAFICVIGFILPILSTGGTSVALTKAAGEMSQKLSAGGTSVAIMKAADEVSQKLSTGGTSVALTKAADEMSQKLSTGGTSVALTKAADEMLQKLSTGGTSVSLTKAADEVSQKPSTGGTSVSLTKAADEVSQSMEKVRERLSVLAGRIPGPEKESVEIEVVKAFIDAINSQDIASLGKLMTEDHAFMDGTGGIPTGRNTILSGWRQYYKMFPDYVINIESIHQDGSIVAVFGSTSGTYNGKEGMKAENKVGGPAAWKATVEDGKVKIWKVYAEYTETWKVIQANQ